MRDELHYNVVRKLLGGMDEDEILCWLDRAGLTPSDEYVLYQCAHGEGKQKVLARLLERQSLAKTFFFLSDYWPKWLADGALEKLAYPKFKTFGLPFQTVIENLTGDRYNKEVLKLLAALVISFGVRPLNNYLNLRRLYVKRPFSMHEFARLDHSKTFPSIDTTYFIYLDDILSSYSIGRCADLVQSAEKAQLDEICRNISMLGMAKRKLILEKLPRKPRSITDINEVVVKLIAENYPAERELGQTIAAFDKITFKNYEIFVPATVGDLRSLAVELDNCLDRYIPRVLSKETQVMILKEDGVVRYALEVNREDGRLMIRSFLAKSNESVPKAARIRNELYRIFDEQVRK